MINTYEKGDTPRLAMAFTDSEGTPTNPTTVSVTLTRPDRTFNTYTWASPETDVKQESEGNFYMDVEATQPGMWYYRWVGTGDVTTAEDHQFWVSAPRV